MKQEECRIKDVKSLIKYHQSCIDRHRKGLGDAHKRLAEIREFDVTETPPPVLDGLIKLHSHLTKTNDHVIELMRTVTNLSIRMDEAERLLCPVVG